MVFQNQWVLPHSTKRVSRPPLKASFKLFPKFTFLASIQFKKDTPSCINHAVNFDISKLWIYNQIWNHSYSNMLSKNHLHNPFCMKICHYHRVGRSILLPNERRSKFSKNAKPSVAMNEFSLIDKISKFGEATLNQLPYKHTVNAYGGFACLLLLNQGASVRIHSDNVPTTPRPPCPPIPDVLST